MDLPLAAYGTLRPGCGGLERLGVKAKYLGSCTMQGRLWLVREMVEDNSFLVPALYPEEDGVVQADLLEISEEDWGKIDSFEDFAPHDMESSYIRQELVTREGVSVWAFVAADVERINFLRDGDWKKYASHPKAIPLFSLDQ